MDASSSFLRAGKRSLVLGCVLVLAFALYANTLLNGFVYDDHHQVEQNPYVQNFHYIGRILTTTVWSFQGSEGQTNYYRPLMTLSFLLCNKLFQSFPYGFHLVNILLNCVVVWLVFVVCSLLFADETVALLAAAVFALHPIHTEVVAWVAAVTELELAIFYLASFACFLRLGSSQGRQQRAPQLLMCITFVFALLSKEQAMTLLVLAAIYEHFYRADRSVTSWKTKVSRYGGLWLIGGAYLIFRASVLGGLAPVLKHADITPPQLFLSAFSLLGQYISKLFWPHPLQAFYVFRKGVGLGDPRFLLGFAMVLLGCMLFAFLLRHARIYSFALLWIALTLAPVLNARWMATNVFTERYLYLPSVGFCGLVAGSLLWLFRKAPASARMRPWIFTAAGVAFCALAATQITARNRDWRDDWTLLNRTLAIEPHASYMRTDLGVWEWDRNLPEEAERQWRLALADQPDNVVALSDLGLAMVEKKRYGEAKLYLAKAIELRPRYALPHVHLARVYLAEGQLVAAEAEFRKAVAIYPMSTLARNALGKFYFDQGRLADAEAQYRASNDSLPNDEAWNRLGDIYFHDGQTKKAEDGWQQVLRLAPFDSHAHLALGGIYFADGRRTEAEKEYRDVLLMDPSNAEAREHLQKLGATNLPPSFHP